MIQHKRPISDYSRLAILTEAERQELTATYHGLNPVLLLKQINKNLEHLWNLAERPVQQQRKVKTYKASVT